MSAALPVGTYNSDVPIYFSSTEAKALVQILIRIWGAGFVKFEDMKVCICFGAWWIKTWLVSLDARPYNNSK